MAYEIRPYLPADFDQVVMLVEKLQKYFSEIDHDDKHIPFRSREEAARYFLKALDDSSNMNGKIFVSVNTEGLIIGFVQGVILDRSHPNLFYDLTHKKNREGAVGLLFVEDSARGAGVATKLMEMMTRYFIDNRCMSVSLLVSSQNNSAIRLYEKCGFTSCELKMRKFL